MPKARPRPSMLRLRMSCAAAAVLALSSTWHAMAQQRDELRGEVPEDAISDELLRRRQAEDEGKSPKQKESQADQGADTSANAQTPTYQPASDGAVPDEPAPSDSLFSDDAEKAGFAEQPAIEGKRPSTARQRDKEAKERLSPDPKKTATDRKRLSETDADGKASDVTGGIERTKTVDSEADLKIDPGAEREDSIEGLDKKPEEDPYAPVGMRLGSFDVYSSLEQGLTWTDNVNDSVVPEDALLSETTLRLRAQSDWSQHAANIEAYGKLTKSIDGAETDDKEAGVNASLRLDISDELRGIGTLNYLIKPESASSPVIIANVATRPVRQTIDGTAGMEKDMGKLRLSAIGGLAYDIYGDAKLEDNTILPQYERNSLLGTITLRTGYEISPALTPFAELELGQRKYDVEVDSAGYRRSSSRLAARGGLAIDLGEKLRGEVAAGWLQENPEDDRLEDISGATFDANVVWSPERGTNVSLLGSTTVEGTTTPGETGSLLYTTQLSIDRKIRANLTGNAILGASWRDYVGSNGHDLTLSAELGMTWWLNRYLGITGRARHEQVESNLPDRDTKTNSVFLGMKVQR